MEVSKARKPGMKIERLGRIRKRETCPLIRFNISRNDSADDPRNARVGTMKRVEVRFRPWKDLTDLPAGVAAKKAQRKSCQDDKDNDNQSEQ